MTASKNPRCSVIIRCYNEEAHIGRLLSGIMQQTVDDVEIIVVDSGSTDATRAIASRYPVRLLTIDKRAFSFGRSLNMGCAAATGDVLVFASAHVYPVYRDWLEQMLAPFSDERIALVYGKQRGAEITKYSEHRVFARWFPETSDLYQTHPFCNNANAAIRRSLWQEQPFDEELTGLEDLAWARAIREKGYYLAYVAEAEIIHLHDESFRQVYNRYRREAIAFKRIFQEAHFGLRDLIWLSLVNISNDYAHALRDRPGWAELFNIPRFRLAQFWGTFRGHRQHRPLTQSLRQVFYYPERGRSTSDDDGRSPLRIEYHSLSSMDRDKSQQ